MPDRPAEDVSRGNLSRLLEKVHAERSLDLAQFRPRYVERRIGTRLHALGLHTYRQYATYLDAHADEYPLLIDALTINVTQFFRDTPVWETLCANVIPALLKAKTERGRRVLRVWCAGCATGEEPYSVAMCVLSVIEDLDLSGVVLNVIGTDIDRRALTVAKNAEYPGARLGEIPRRFRDSYLEVGKETFRIGPSVRRCVKLHYLNLFEEPPVNVVDLVLCRNVFIYFNREDQERVMASFVKGLTQGGYLVLGRSERLARGVADRFEVVSASDRVYRRVK
jgi:chemotaxis methyl-accepting protein methylase